MSFSHDALVLYGFFLVVGGLLLALRARRAAESPSRNNASMLAGVITMTGLGFWAARASARKVAAGFRKKPMRHNNLEHRPGCDIQDDARA